MRKARQSKAPAKAKEAKKKVPKASKAKIPDVDASMNVMEIIALHPGAADILGAYGLHCFQCAFNTLDSLEVGAKSHGLSDTDIENMVTDIEELLRSSPVPPAMLTLSESGAKALLDIAKAEGKDSCLLRVGSDDSGGFCMEFAELTLADDRTFTNAAVQGVAIIASPQALHRVGGATVDFREGRFKLDLPKAKICGCKGKECSCEKRS